jgi:hypothetical protein
LPEAPKRITGRGGSPYAAYEGDGYYEVEVVDEGLIRLRATPNASLLEPVDKSFFDTGRLDRPLVELNREPRAFRLLLPGWERFTCQREDGESVPVEDRAFALTPGVTYLLRKAE